MDSACCWALIFQFTTKLGGPTGHAERVLTHHCQGSGDSQRTFTLLSQEQDVRNMMIGLFGDSQAIWKRLKLYGLHQGRSLNLCKNSPIPLVSCEDPWHCARWGAVQRTATICSKPERLLPDRLHFALIGSLSTQVLPHTLGEP